MESRVQRRPSKSNRSSATYLPVWMYLALYRWANPAIVLETAMFSYKFCTIPAFDADEAVFEQYPKFCDVLAC